MRIPRRPPSQGELWAKIGLNQDKLFSLLEKTQYKTHNDVYIHWDKLRYLTPPDGLSHEDWWFGLKIRRMQPKRIPLRDAKGQPFAFNLVDPLPECLHHADSHARGSVQMPALIT